ncbi:trypsin-like peptidase domain-containing protein [Sorangium sp. So ce513]|uniref:trypsin-like peptidase domain-containing protein n=1 Tax=Sorangium sp. So ce513 TaxID=3133315 RepID=UPI003F604EB1
MHVSHGRKHRQRGMATASLVSVAALAVAACSTAGCSRVTPPEEEPPPKEEPPTTAELVSGQDPQNAYLRAVGSLNRNSCTGSLIKTGDNADAPAYALTAGRCVMYPFHKSMYFDVGVDQTLVDTLSFMFNDFNDTPDGERVEASGVRLTYVTMRGADMALVELDRTIGELQALGIEPLPLADAPPAAGDPIELAVVPVRHDGGEYPEAFVRRARCREGARRPNVVEHQWHWVDMHVNTCGGMGPGAAGGPAIDGRGRVFGVFTTYFSSVAPLDTCYQGYPCEVGGGEPERGVQGASYVVDVTGMARCFDAEGRFDLSAAGCALDPGGHASLGETPSRIASPTLGEPPEPSGWGVRISPTSGTFDGSETSDTHYRYKVGPVESVDCRSAEGYSAPIAIEDDRLVKLPVPAQEGLYAMCVLTGSGAVGGAGWQSVEHPTVILKKVRVSSRVTSGPDAGDVTTEQMFDIASQAVDAYRDHMRDHQARFSVNVGTATGTKIDIAADRTWHIHLGVDLRRQGVSPPDLVAFAACHEIGHALGGFPFKRSFVQQQQVEGLATGQYGTVSSTEGQADYFATKECLPRLWSAEREVNARFRETVTGVAKARCDAAWDDVDAQNLCYRLATVAERFGRWGRRPEDSRPVPELSTPDTSEVMVTKQNNPALQCRVDTAFQGALCRTKFRGTAIPGLIPPYEQVLTFSPEVEAAAAPDACTEGPGSRPLCWFAPNATAPDCTGIPELGMCDVIDGESVVVQCSQDEGIERFVCPPQTPCGVDEGGWADCGL